MWRGGEWRRLAASLRGVRWRALRIAVGAPRSASRRRSLAPKCMPMRAHVAETFRYLGTDAAQPSMFGVEPAVPQTHAPADLVEDRHLGGHFRPHHRHPGFEEPRHGPSRCGRRTPAVLAARGGDAAVHRRRRGRRRGARREVTLMEAVHTQRAFADIGADQAKMVRAADYTDEVVRLGRALLPRLVHLPCGRRRHRVRDYDAQQCVDEAAP